MFLSRSGPANGRSLTRHTTPASGITNCCSSRVHITPIVHDIPLAACAVADYIQDRVNGLQLHRRNVSGLLHGRHHNLRIVSFNCRSVKTSFTTVKELCDKNDLILLQEHWLMPDEIGCFQIYIRTFWLSVVLPLM